MEVLTRRVQYIVCERERGVPVIRHAPNVPSFLYSTTHGIQNTVVRGTESTVPIGTLRVPHLSVFEVPHLSVIWGYINRIQCVNCWEYHQGYLTCQCPWAPSRVPRLSVLGAPSGYLNCQSPILSVVAGTIKDTSLAVLVLPHSSVLGLPSGVSDLSVVEDTII